MKVLKVILFGVIGIIALVVIAGLFMDSNMTVEREAVIDAPVEVVYAHLATPKLRSKWDPWLELDPNATVTYEGPESGVGAINTWSSDNSDLGTGRQEILEAEENEMIKTKVTMDMMGDNEIYSQFDLEPTEDNKTKIKWSMTADSDGGLFAPMMSRMGEFFVGMSFDQGLKNISSLMTTVNYDDFAKKDENGPSIEDIAVVTYLGHDNTSTSDPADISKAMQTSYAAIGQYMGENQIQMAGAPLVVVSKWAPEENRYDFTAGMPVAGSPEGKGDIKLMKWGEGMQKMAKITHVGGYADMESVYGSLMAFIEKEGYQIAGNPMEQYMNDPGNTPEEELITVIAFPVVPADKKS